MNMVPARPWRLAAVVLVALLSGYGLWQAAVGGVGFYHDLSFLHRARLVDEYRQAQKAQEEAAKAKAAPKAVVSADAP